MENNKSIGGEEMYGPDGDDDLVEFCFVSQVAPDLPAAVFLRLARQSWSFNTRMGLSGELRLQDGRFVEAIEGRCEVVQALAARILADPRHGSIRIAAFRRLAVRRHAGWTVSGFDLAGPAADTVGRAANLQFIPDWRRPAAAMRAAVPGVGALSV